MAKPSSIVTDSGKVRRVIVVGGGLAGLMTVIKLCEAGHPGRPVLARPGEALALGLRAGRHQRRA